MDYCTLSSYIYEVNRATWSGITSLSNYQLPVLVVRILHNKLRYSLTTGLDCLTGFHSPLFPITLTITTFPIIIYLSIRHFKAK